ncbi:MAG TPA: hypothetical protein VHG28_11070 [Longimicrobiaceae bacterium]|nr:hypothetical protein [Longimicrobiaceae bacterium]
MPVHLSVACIAVLLGGGAAGAAALRSENESGYVPSARIELGTNHEIVLVFLGASFCGASQRKGFDEVVEQGKILLSNQAKKDGRTFRTIGVALDWDTDKGIEFLEEFGRFDEIAAGGNWGSDPAIKYIWRDLPGRSAVPQIVILERQIEETPRATEVTREVVLRRLHGIEEIESWVANGARVSFGAATPKEAGSISGKDPLVQGT